MSRKLARLGCYVSLLSSKDTKSQQVMKYSPLLDALSVKVADKARLLSHWEQGLTVQGKEGLDDANAERLSKVKASLTYHFLYARSLAKHSLPEEVEKIIHRKDINGIDVVDELYEKIVTNFSYTFQPEGEEAQEFSNQKHVKDLVFHPKASYRKAAYESMFTPYKGHKEILFTIYAAILKDWKVEQDLRQYPSAISRRNRRNRVSDEIVQLVLDVVAENKALYQEFFKLKAKELGVEKLSRYDLYAPMKESQRTFTFEEAKALVLETFENFHPPFAEKARRLFEKRHIDSHPTDTKRGGAFCMSVSPDIDPYVMLNFSGKMKDAETMAHELGHAVHDMYAHDLPISVFHSPLPLAETASTFSEFVLFERLLAEADPKEKKIMLMEQLAGSYGTILRQAYFAKFEIEAHEKIPKGLTEEELADLFIANLREQFGDAVDVPGCFRYEWSYMPHIFASPFYVYAYSFGELLSMALFAQYKKDPQAFLPKLEAILSAGRSQDPATLLKSQGFDITDRAFWEGGFVIVKGWLEDVKKL